MSLLNNLRVRGRLLRAALTRRFVYPDVVSLALEHGHLPVVDVAADLEPFAFFEHVAGDGAMPRVDFTALASLAVEESETTAEWTSERGTAEFVARLAALMRAQTVFEIGCFTGYTTAHLATVLHAANRDGRLHYLDFDAAHLAKAAARLRQLQLDHLATPHRGRSTDPAVLAALPATADLVFIDTTHGYEDTRDEIALYGRRLAPRGLLVLHDSIRFPGVRQAIGEVRAAYRVFTFATERGNGLTVLVPRAR